jgi:hypothetical protein
MVPHSLALDRSKNFQISGFFIPYMGMLLLSHNPNKPFLAQFCALVPPLSIKGYLNKVYQMPGSF